MVLGVLLPGEGVPGPGGCLVLGDLPPGGVPGPRGVPGGDPPGWLLLRVVHILLECILVILLFSCKEMMNAKSIDINVSFIS